ncbi:hypothetical protein [Oceaniradius stylonematis]|jgi:hypothetical protein
MEQIDVTPNGNEPRRPMDWLKEELTVSLPRYWLVLAAVAALVLVAVALD